MDYHPDKSLRLKFHRENGPPIWFTNKTEGNILMGDLDEEGYQFRTLLGVWKPLSPAKVCDYPLAVMDARTFKPDNQVPYELHINFIAGIFHNLNGAISFSPDQQWYYFARQSTQEVLIFHQYTKVSRLGASL